MCLFCFISASPFHRHCFIFCLALARIPPLWTATQLNPSSNTALSLTRLLSSVCSFFILLGFLRSSFYFDASLPRFLLTFSRFLMECRKSSFQKCRTLTFFAFFVNLICIQESNLNFYQNPGSGIIIFVRQNLLYFELSTFLSLFYPYSDLVG